VILPHPPWGPFAYTGRVPRGGVVFVPLKHRITVGVVWEEGSPAPGKELKPVAGFTGAVLPQWVLEALENLSARTGYPPGRFLAYALPPGAEDLYRLQVRPRVVPLEIPGVRPRLLQALSDRRWRSWLRLRKTTGATARDLLRLLEAEAIEVRAHYPQWETSPPSPTSSRSPQVFYGLSLREKRRVLEAWAVRYNVMFWVADPLLAHFWSRFLGWPAYTSHTPVGERRRIWRDALTGRLSGVVITRAGFLLPFPRPVLVVDEPWMEGFFFREPLTLAAVLPALSVPIRIFRSGPDLPEETLPGLQVVLRLPEGSPRWKVRTRPRFFWKTVERALERGHNLAFWVERKGSGYLRCEACGWRSRCPQEDALLVFFRYPEPRLLCPRCGWESPLPLRCPSCGNEGLEVQGRGLEAVARILKDRFPRARVFTFAARPDNPAALQRLLQVWERGGADILVGTWAARAAFVHPATRWLVAWYPESTLHRRSDEWQLALRLAWLTWMREEGRVLLTTRKDLPLFQHLERGSLRSYFAKQYRQA